LISPTVPLRSIQILRALAASLVVFGHGLHETDYIASRTAQPLLDTSYFDWGFGVDIFFVISGFIMIYTTANDFGLPGAAGTFLTRRLVRIAPLYWLMTMGIILVAVVAPRFLNVPIEGWRSTLTSFLFIPDLRGNGEVRPILAAGWTLNYEMFFYALFACGLLLPLRRGVLLLSGAFVALSILGWTVALPGVALAFWTSSIILEFALGMLIGLACRSQWRLPASAAVVMTVLGFALAIALGPHWGWSQYLPRCLSGGLPAAMIVAAVAWGPNLPATWFVTLLVGLGDASYSLYLTHPFVIRPLRNIWMAVHGGSMPLGLYVIVAVLAAMTVSVLIYRYIEKPMTNGLQRLVHGPKKPFPSAPARTTAKAKHTRFGLRFGPRAPAHG
jgi:exopolysaccharide production protein ExoZ